MENLETKVTYCENEDGIALFALYEGTWYRVSQWYNCPNSLYGKTSTIEDINYFGWDKL